MSSATPSVETNQPSSSKRNLILFGGAAVLLLLVLGLLGGYVAYTTTSTPTAEPVETPQLEEALFKPIEVSEHKSANYSSIKPEPDQLESVKVKDLPFMARSLAWIKGKPALAAGIAVAVVTLVAALVTAVVVMNSSHEEPILEPEPEPEPLEVLSDVEESFGTVGAIILLVLGLAMAGMVAYVISPESFDFSKKLTPQQAYDEFRAEYDRMKQDFNSQNANGCTRRESIGYSNAVTVRDSNSNLLFVVYCNNEYALADLHDAIKRSEMFNGVQDFFVYSYSPRRSGTNLGEVSARVYTDTYVDFDPNKPVKFYRDIAQSLRQYRKTLKVRE